MRRARVPKSESNELVLVDEIENGKHHNINLRYNRFKPTLLPELSVLDSGDEGQTIVLSFNDGDWYICSEDLDSRIDCLDCDGELRRVDRDLVSLGCQEIVRIKQKHGEIIDTAALIEIVSQVSSNSIFFLSSKLSSAKERVLEPSNFQNDSMALHIPTS